MEFEILNRKSVESVTFRSYPYKLGVIEGVIVKEAQDDLLDTFPIDGFRRVMKSSEEKSYEMNIRPLLKSEANDYYADFDLNRSWVTLLKELKSNEYRTLMSDITGIPLSGCDLEINLWEYSNGSSLSVHTDKKEKLVTHLIYFNEDWKDEWGGHFCIHTENNQLAVYDKILPVMNTSLVLITAENSWHSVSAVVKDANVSRRGLQVIFKV